MNICFKFLITCYETLNEGKDGLKLYGTHFPLDWKEPGGLILKKKKTNL